MSNKPTLNTSIPDVFAIGWFQFPVGIDKNYEIVVVFHDVLVVSSLLTNPVLLFIIVKTYGRSSGKNSAILLGCICLINVLVACFGLLALIGGLGIDFGIMTGVLSVFFPMYYVATFCLALNYYGLIVAPLKFQTLSPTPGTTVGILGSCFLTLILVFVPASVLASDFELYSEIMLTTVVAVCWFTSILIALMYKKILFALYRRKVTLRRTLNMTRSRQGLLVIKQNTRLAKTLFFYILVQVVLTLPLYTCLILAMQCTWCNQTAMMKFCLYAIPGGMCMPVIHVFHWLFFTPQYYREIKRLAKKMFNLVRQITGN